MNPFNGIERGGEREMVNVKPPKYRIHSMELKEELKE